MSAIRAIWTITYLLIPCRSHSFFSCLYRTRWIVILIDRSTLDNRARMTSVMHNVPGGETRHRIRTICNTKTAETRWESGCKSSATFTMEYGTNTAVYGQICHENGRLLWSYSDLQRRVIFLLQFRRRSRTNAYRFPSFQSTEINENICHIIESIQPWIQRYCSFCSSWNRCLLQLLR